MLESLPAPASDRPVCPICKGPVSFIRSIGAGGLRRWEVATFLCPIDGVVYRTREGLEGRDDSSDDRDSLVGVPRTPAPPSNIAAAAVPEPELD